MTSTDGQLPIVLRERIEHLMEGVPVSALNEAFRHLSQEYKKDAQCSPALASQVERLAYVASRLPATFAATQAVFRELRRHRPDAVIGSLLELGAGPAPGLWAAREVFPHLTLSSHVESNVEMAELGRQLLAKTELATLVRSTWYMKHALEVADLPRHDVVLMAYLVGELTGDIRPRLINAAWQATRVALVIVEPGTPSGTARVLDARAWLVEQGANVVAPCPHTGLCPLPSDDWCHFGARLNRSSLQRRLKGGTLPFEDEKYAYVVVSREPVERCNARILRRPDRAQRSVTLRLCATDGLRTERVTRGQPADYRLARKARWGGVWDPPARVATTDT